jgi:hypothetical protein
MNYDIRGGGIRVKIVNRKLTGIHGATIATAPGKTDAGSPRSRSS